MSLTKRILESIDEKELHPSKHLVPKGSAPLMKADEVYAILNGRGWDSGAFDPEEDDDIGSAAELGAVALYKTWWTSPSFEEPGDLVIITYEIVGGPNEGKLYQVMSSHGSFATNMAELNEIMADTDEE